MKLIPLIAENWKADGGAVFGVVPKTMWNAVCPADENNLVNSVSRVLLIDEGDRLTLIDTGMGDKQDDKFFGHRHLFGHRGLIEAMAGAGYSPEQVTDVVFTHLHYDHVGGAVRRADGGFQLVFPQAAHWVSRAQWDWAMNPNKREVASYLPENLLPLRDAGVLTFVEKEGRFSDRILFRFFNGHTRGQIIPVIDYDGVTVVYTADFLASSAHIPLPWIPSYDIEPLVSLEEKESFLHEAADNNYVIVLEHDFYVEALTVKHTSKGVRLGAMGSLHELVSNSRSARVRSV